MINKSNIGEVSIEEKGFKLTIKQKEEPAQNVIAAPMHASMPSYAPPVAVAAPTSLPPTRQHLLQKLQNPPQTTSLLSRAR